MECYIIKPSVNIKKICKTTSFHSKTFYIATKNSKYFSSPDSIVYFYSEKDGREGIVGYGKPLEWPVMSHKVPVEYQKSLYAKDLLQFPIHFNEISHNIYFEKKYLLQLPGMNVYGKIDLAIPDYLYNTLNLEYEMDYIIKSSRSCFGPEITDSNYRLWFHLLRERRKKYGYRRILKGRKFCSLCKMKYEPYDELRSDFFELHENVEIDFNEKFRKILMGNFIVLCPNCHKKEHDKIMNS